MKHGFFSLKQFLSHITKFPRGFWSSGIIPFTRIYLAGFFIHFDLNLWSLFKIRRFLKKWLENFFTFSEKNYRIFMLMTIQRDFFIPHLNPCFSWRNVIPPFKRREEWHILVISPFETFYGKILTRKFCKKGGQRYQRGFCTAPVQYTTSHCVISI